jgi:hypothetical protein
VDTTEARIRAFFEHDPFKANQIIAKMRKDWLRTQLRKAAEEITQMNNGYFIHPNQPRSLAKQGDEEEQLHFRFDRSTAEIEAAEDWYKAHRLLSTPTGQEHAPPEDDKQLDLPF